MHTKWYALDALSNYDTRDISHRCRVKGRQSLESDVVLPTEIKKISNHRSSSIRSFILRTLHTEHYSR